MRKLFIGQELRPLQQNIKNQKESESMMKRTEGIGGSIGRVDKLNLEKKAEKIKAEKNSEKSMLEKKSEKIFVEKNSEKLMVEKKSEKIFAEKKLEKLGEKLAEAAKPDYHLIDLLKGVSGNDNNDDRLL